MDPRRRYLFLAILAGSLVGFATLVAMGGVDGRVGLGSVAEIWGDFLRDADSVALNATRVTDEDEEALGDRIAASIAETRSDEPEATSYVAAVGQSLVPFVERERISYEFHVIESEAVSAFAIPGGHVYVTTAMLDDFLQSEAELAAILGHEISHIDRRHCIERYQYILRAEDVGAGSLGLMAELARRLVAAGYRQYQEVEADEEGFRMALDAGYDPWVSLDAFTRLGAIHGEPTGAERADGPVEEVIESIDEAIGSYGRSHPPSSERGDRLVAWLQRNRGRIAGNSFYIGRANLELRVARSQEELRSEFILR